MADENKPEDDNDELFDDTEVSGDTPSGDDAPAETPGPSEGSEDQLLQDASAAAAKKGIMVPADAKNCKEWIQHFITAMNTHQATSDQAAAGAGSANDMSMDSQATMEQPQVGVAMSAAQVAHVNWQTGQLADERLAFRKRQISALVKKGKATPAQAKQWLGVLDAKRLSLASATPSGDVNRVLAQIDLAKSIPEGTYSDVGESTTQLSATAADAAAKPAELPDYAKPDGKGKVDRGTLDRMCGGKLSTYEEKQKAGAK